ncbi:MAG: leucyl aminopeptidase [Mariprofundaceae bacterium]|nr:leucyl aminopeptidase [Mariprofundaceae bacterium]
MISIHVNTTATHCDTVLLSLGKAQQLSPSGVALQKQAHVAHFLSSNDHQGEFAKTRTLYGEQQRIIFVGSGEESKLTLQKLRALAAKIAAKIKHSGAKDVAVHLAELDVVDADISDKIQALSEGFILGLYTFDAYQTCQDKKEQTLQSISFIVNQADVVVAEEAVAIGQAVAIGTNFARDLGNEPGNVCTPEYLGEQALALSHPKLKVNVMDKAAIEKAGFTALLAVSQGSDKEPRFITLQYNGANNNDAPIALVGKGLTFDAGGISIKPAAAMDEMKFDMCGSAAVLGIFKAVTALNLPINLLGVIPSSENLLGGSAYKPGDIVTTYKGLTIEVLNTDAEGRVILSDALAYAAEQKPAEIIDFATLTGACVIALGAQATGLMGTSTAIKQALVASGQKTHDRVWEMPMFEEYQEQINSKIADIKNTGGREAGTITAACFLSRFVDDIPWAHLDIAGTAWNMKGNDISPVGGATGAGVRLIVDYLQHKISTNNA